MYTYGEIAASDIEYLEAELERERERREQLEKEEQERQLERRQRWNCEARSAETWPEALEKQASLMAREARYEEENFEYGGTYFSESIKGCHRALEIWPEVEASKQEEITELQQRLEAIQNEIRLEVAAKLREEGDNQGWESIASSIENDEDLTDWLNW